MNRYLKVTITWTSLLLVLAGFCTVSNAQYNRAADAHGFTVYLTDGGWCWYQDPRAALNDGHLLIGAVKGNGDGEAIVGVYDLEANQPLAKVVVNPAFDHDDHNSPVFFVRPDNRVLTVYARHNVDNIHHLRVSEAGDLSKWGPPSEFAHDYADNVRVTYMNLLEMRDEGKLYNFFRGADWNPWFITSTDGGDSWGEPTHFIGDELEGVQRPYCRYAGNGKDSVFVSLTDAHPRQYGNSIYYAEFRGGKFFKADGSLVKDLKADGPLLPSEADLVYQGSGLPGRGHALSAEGAAWTSSIAADKQGHPHIAYTLYLSNTDHRYRLASWDGNKWVDREVAYAGNCLYDDESSYTGLITVDPVDPSIVFISTDVNPSSGQATGGLHEIYRARIGLEDDISTINWESVTRNSPVRNIRPMVLNDGAVRVVLWQRGEFISYRIYDLDTVGFMEAAQ